MNSAGDLSPVQVSVWACQWVTLTLLRSSTVAQLKAGLLKQMGLVLKSDDVIMRIGDQVINDESFPCERLPQESLEIGLKTRQFINIEEDADGGTAPATHGDASFAESNAAAQTMLNKFKNVAKKGADVDAQVKMTVEEAVKQIDVLLECYTRAILDLDDLRPKRSDPSHAEIISRRNSEIARVKGIQAALNASKASYRNVLSALQSDVAINVRG